MGISSGNHYAIEKRNLKRFCPALVKPNPIYAVLSANGSNLFSFSCSHTLHVKVHPDDPRHHTYNLTTSHSLSDG